MKNIRFLTFVLAIVTILLSACAGAAAPTSAPEAAAVGKVQAMPVSFIGVIDSMDGDQWVISGTTVTVDESIVRDGPFQIGDQVKVEGSVSSDGSLTVSRVESPTPQETATVPPLVDDNSNDALTNANDNANINDDNGNDANINDDNNANSNDDNSNSANSNDDNGNDGNSNDDNGGSNSNDDHGNDDNSGSGSGSNSNDDHGGDDNGSDD